MSIDSFNFSEPKICKAKFIFPNDRFYTLDFDHNIQMNELKLMIQKAAHLKRNNFRIFSEGKEYTQYNSEIFSSFFPNKDLVIFNLELIEDDESSESELLLQINSPCNIHSDKFLLYYCFTCNTSICNDCFNFGSHKNHIILDKCFYLLPSKYLVEKMFANWSQNPYEDIKISTDLSQLKNNLNSVLFKELFDMLKKIQDKCNMLIDEYNKVNESSLGNIRNSVRDIKLSCIKALDGLKDDLNIKNMVNNQEIFVEFDKAYKDLAKLQNEKYKKNMENFDELNKKISILVDNLIKQIYSTIYKTLNEMSKDSQFENIKTQINMKLIKPHEEEEIINKININKKKRNSFNINSNNFVKVIAANVQKKLNSDPSKDKINNIQNIKSINPFIIQEDKSQNQNNKTTITNNNKINFGYNNITIPNNLPNSLDKITFGVNQGQKNISEKNKINVSESEPFSSAQIERQKLSINMNQNVNNYNTDLLNKKNKISFLNSNKIEPPFINNINNISSISNINNSSDISNLNLINQTQPQIYKTIVTNTNIISNNDNNNGASINQIQHQHQYNGITSPTPEIISNDYKIINNIENDLSIDVRKYFKSKYILSPIPQTNSIKILTSNNLEESTIPVKFPENFGFNTFFLDCAHCNCQLNKCLYVTGGIESTSENNRSNVLLCIDITQNDELKVKKLANMNFARCAHTMISEGKYIYVLGGEDLNSVERYDIENDIWEILPSMICKRMYPILHIKNGYLYAFFGKYKNGDYPCSIERLNINNNDDNIKPAWEMVIFSNPKNLDIRIYGSALLEYSGMLYFFGGKINETTSNKIYFYNFETRIIEKEDTEVLWYEYFRENKLYPINERVVQCSDNKYFGVYITIQEQD
jgi:hypothetical protein